MKSYRAHVKATPFNWKRFLAKTKHSEAMWEKADIAALEWPSCACGNQDYRIPRYDTDIDPGMIGMPIDNKLSDLGASFYHEAVQYRDIRKARSIMKQIEARAAQIIAKLP